MQILFGEFWFSAEERSGGFEIHRQLKVSSLEKIKYRE